MSNSTALSSESYPAPAQVPVERYRVMHVDDDEDALELIEDLLGDEVELRSCAQGQAAVQAALEFQPDVFLIDLKLGAVDGLDLVNELATHEAFGKSPFIMLSSVDSAANKAACFARGASDYLVKFPDALELMARVRYHAEASRRRQDLQRLQRDMSERQHALEADLRFAAEVQHELLSAPLRGGCVDSAAYVLPCGLVSGDFYQFDRHPDGSCAIFLGDATGHGIAAAFITIMAGMGLAQVRQSLMTSKVLRQLDALLTPTIPGGHFMTGMAVHIALDGQLRMSAGGHPPLLWVPADGSDVLSLKGDGLPMGIALKNKQYGMQHHQLAQGDKVILYTDGVLERENDAGEAFGAERLRAFVAAHRHRTVDDLASGLAQSLEEFAGDTENGDDLTLIVAEYRGLP